MPSRNIECAEFTGSRATLRCDIRSGVKPLPPKPASCEFDWGAGYIMGRRGRAHVSCVSDSVHDPSARILRYGTIWRRDGLHMPFAARGTPLPERGRPRLLPEPRALVRLLIAARGAPLVTPA